MPLQQLVEYFNDRLEQEHNNSIRAFVYQDGIVHGIFGPICLGSQLSPIRETLRSSHSIGHYAQLRVTANPKHALESLAADHLLDAQPLSGAGLDSVINFDRLSRTVHMLNYLPQSHLEKLLFLDVDPRHILGIKEDHGAYFEEIIVKCGLNTSNVAISLTVNSVYARLYPVLLKGLENYQRRGYQLLLKFDWQSLDKSAEDLIVRVSPNFVGFQEQNLNQVRDNTLLQKLQKLNALAASVGGRGIMFNVEDKQSAALARRIGFALVQGEYFEKPVSASSYYGSYTGKSEALTGLKLGYDNRLKP